MPYIPRWIGYVGLVLSLIFCGAFLAGQLWFAVLLMIPCFALVILENRHERGLMGTRGG
jgi:membrane-bound ClpP family serine protease